MLSKNRLEFRQTAQYDEIWPILDLDTQETAVETPHAIFLVNASKSFLQGADNVYDGYP